MNVSPFYVLKGYYMDLLEVGKIVNTHGLRGEVKVVPWTDYPEVFEDIEYVYIQRRGEYERLDVK